MHENHAHHPGDLLRENATLRAERDALLAENARLRRALSACEEAQGPQEAHALLDSAAVLRAVLEQLPIGVIIAEAPSGRLLMHNAEAVRLLGHPLRSGPDYAGYAQYGGLYPDGRPYAPEDYPLARALRHETVVPAEDLRYRRGDDTTTTLAVSAAPVRDRTGRVVAVVSAFTDVAAQRAAEQALRELEARFAAAFQGSPVALAITVHADGRILDANARFLELFGTSQDALAGQSTLTLGMWDDPAARERTLAVLNRDGRVRDREVIVRAAGGARRHILLSMEPLHINGAPCLLSALTDITERVEAVAALNANAMHLRTVIEHAGMAIWAVDAEQRLTLANNVFRRYAQTHLGAPIALGERLPSPALPEPMRHTFDARYRRALGGETVQGEWVVELPSGSLFATETTFNPIVDAGGRVVGVTCFARDITGRKERDEQLRRSEERFRLFIAQAPAAVAMLDRDLRYLAASQRWKEDYGITGEVVGQRHYAVFPALSESWKAIHQRALAGAVERVEDQAFTRADGGRAWVKREVRPWYDTTGAIGGIVVFSEDITARKQAEAALQRSEALYRAIVRSLPDAGVLVVDPALRYLLAEGPLLPTIGMDRERMEGRTPAEVFDSQRSQPMEARWRRAFGGEEIVDERVIGERTLWTHVTPLRDSDGQIWAAMALMLDITERTRLEAQLLQAQKMESIGQLAGGIAHDFNNLLTAIGGYVEFARAEVPPDAAVQADLSEIQRATERAATLTRQLLAFARRQRMQLQPLDLSALVAGTEKLLRRLIGEHIQLVVEAAPDLPQTLADPGQLEQVLINLAFNARDAMPEGGKLVIATANVEREPRYGHGQSDLPAGHYVLLTVSDTGVGIPPEHQPHLFEPFFTTKPVGQGTGLGLATCYGIIKQHGGTMFISSEPGRGTVVTVYLPRGEAEPVETAPKPAAAQLPRGTETVLLAEDEPAVRALAARILNACGYTVLVAENGVEALRRARAHAPEPIHLLLTDVVMPVLGGPGLAAQLQAHYPALRVLFMSGYADLRAVSQEPSALEAPLLQKPFLPLSLATAVRAILDAT